MLVADRVRFARVTAMVYSPWCNPQGGPSFLDLPKKVSFLQGFHTPLEIQSTVVFRVTLIF